MYHIDSIATSNGRTLVEGWIAEGPSRVVAARFSDDEKETSVEGFGLPSPDLVGSFGPGNENARFSISLDDSDPNGFLVFDLSDGRKVSLPIGSKLDARSLIEPLVHQIYEGRFIGRYRLLQPLEIISVALSQGLIDDADSIQLPEIKLEEDELSVDSEIGSDWSVDLLRIYFKLADGSFRVLANVGNSERAHIDGYQIFNHMLDWINANQDSLNIVEIGSRARSGNTRRHAISDRHRYTGFDLKEGPNVDIVGDAHELTKRFEPNSINAIFGLEVFEHLAMPWKVALEINKVLKLGGRCMFFTVQTWPIHDEPFDFFRFSKEAWHSLFNQYTGFRILEAAVGDPARIVADLQTEANREILLSKGYLVSSVWCEKITDTKLSWNVPAKSLYESEYPA